MTWVRRNRGKAAVLVVFAFLLVLALVRGALGAGRSSTGADGTPALALPTSTPSHVLTAVPTPDPESSPVPTAAPSPAITGAPAEASPGQLGVPVTAGGSPYGGLQGHRSAQSVPTHHVVLSLWSDHKLPFVIFNIPTSRDHPGGQRTDLGRTWSLSTTVRGKPDYAQLFTRAGPEGYPITCQITVDGRVTARQTRGGPYGKVFCQG